MWKKIAVAGATAATIVGAGTAALAASGSSGSPSSSGSGNAVLPAASASASAGPSGSASAQSAAGRKHRPLQRLKKFEHGTWVTSGPNGETVTHSAIHGTVTAVSATSITVRAADKTSETFVVNSATKVHTPAQKKGAPISAVKSGDTVVVTGHGTGPVTATQLLDRTK
jgi:preprotein translocase subunit YajC